MTTLIRGLHNLRDQVPESVVTIGNFDGLHVGHQKLLENLLQKTKELHVPSVVILFEPQPNEFFAKDKAPARLMRFREKLMGLQQMGVDYVLCLKFNQKLANVSAQDFVKNILVDKLKVRHVLIGDDFRFGYKRSGDIHLLKTLGQQYHFTVDAVDTFHIQGERVSSTRIREALQTGDLKTAEKLLGKPYGIWGYVVHGDKRGRIIGFPTANIFLHRKTAPISGVFVVLVSGIADKPLQAVANMGNRPTVDGTRSVLEIHLFDFDQTIYGEHLYVEFIHKLREEKRFESFEKLKEQITKDAQAAREYFK